MKRRIAILGSTGSIGTQSLDVISRFPDLFTAEILTANRNAELLVEQALKFEPNAVVIADKSKYKYVAEALSGLPIKVFAGEDSISDVIAGESTDMVLAAMVGFAGLKPVINAIRNNKTIALANKETLVVAGELIRNLALEHHSSIIPVDSEHSAIFQCLAGETGNPVESIILTASGGPFRTKTPDELNRVTVDDALAHPNWNMGAKITIDSASMMNKGLEVIEARWLFDVAPEHIKVVVHPQSIVHSLVEFADGSVKAQLGLPDMRLPIQYALSYPHRLENNFERLNLSQIGSLTFEKPDAGKFPCLTLAYEAVQKGGNMPCILNAANEVAVSLFLNHKIRFVQIPDIIASAMQKIHFTPNPSLNDLFDTNREARDLVLNLI